MSWSFLALIAGCVFWPVEKVAVWLAIKSRRAEQDWIDAKRL
jgi:heme/copper-type cytochrome/quinol oxidase subunit 2